MTFKVGDIGKTRGGDDYEVIAIHRGTLWVERAAGMFSYYLDGRIAGSQDHIGALLPPKKKIEGFMTVYSDGTAEFTCSTPTREGRQTIMSFPHSFEYEDKERR